jgi:hypothetical protein
MAVSCIGSQEPVVPYDIRTMSNFPRNFFFLENFNKKNLEALHVDNAWTGFIILSLGDPHLPTQSPIVKELKME